MSEGLNRGECLDHVTLGLRMDIDDVRAGGGEKFNLAGRILDHKVHVDELVGGSSHGLDVFETHGEIGNETAVHHVAMEDVDAGGVEILDGRTQIAVVGAHETGAEQHSELLICSVIIYSVEINR